MKQFRQETTGASKGITRRLTLFDFKMQVV